MPKGGGEGGGSEMVDGWRLVENGKVGSVGKVRAKFLLGIIKTRQEQRWRQTELFTCVFVTVTVIHWWLWIEWMGVSRGGTSVFGGRRRNMLCFSLHFSCSLLAGGMFSLPVYISIPVCAAMLNIFRTGFYVFPRQK